MRLSAIEFVESRHKRKDLVEFRPGDTVRVWWKIKEGEKERAQAFEGVCIRKTRGGTDASFTVRKMSFGVGVERIFPLHSPRYESIEVVVHGDVRRNRLFYLRGLKGKAARLDHQDDQAIEAAAAAEALAAERKAGEEKPAAPKKKGKSETAAPAKKEG